MQDHPDSQPQERAKSKISIVLKSQILNESVYAQGGSCLRRGGCPAPIPTPDVLISRNMWLLDHPMQVHPK